MAERLLLLLHIGCRHSPQQNRLYSDLYKNASLWRWYTHDPYADGFGIYLVFWFGEDRGGPVPSPTQGVARPDSATALEYALRSCIPKDKAYCLDVIVLDVTLPAATKRTRMKTGRRK
jgi:hypothetical protein